MLRAIPPPEDAALEEGSPYLVNLFQGFDLTRSRAIDGAQAAESVISGTTGRVMYGNCFTLQVLVYWY